MNVLTDRRLIGTYGRNEIAWAVDDCSKTKQAVDGSLHLHNLTDLHFRYRLPPLASRCQRWPRRVGQEILVFK